MVAVLAKKQREILRWWWWWWWCLGVGQAAMKKTKVCPAYTATGGSALASTKVMNTKFTNL